MTMTDTAPDTRTVDGVYDAYIYFDYADDRRAEDDRWRVTVYALAENPHGEGYMSTDTQITDFALTVPEDFDMDALIGVQEDIWLGTDDPSTPTWLRERVLLMVAASRNSG